MPEFIWIETHGAQVRHRPRVQRIPYGDGYEVRIGLGINRDPQSWDLAFEDIDHLVANEIDDFLAARGGLEAFDWVSPRGQNLQVVCREWTRTNVRPRSETIRATFEQVFQP